MKPELKELKPAAKMLHAYAVIYMSVYLPVCLGRVASVAPGKEQIGFPEIG